MVIRRRTAADDTPAIKRVDSLDGDFIVFVDSGGKSSA